MAEVLHNADYVEFMLGGYSENGAFAFGMISSGHALLLNQLPCLL